MNDLLAQKINELRTKLEELQSDTEYLLTAELCQVEQKLNLIDCEHNLAQLLLDELEELCEND